MHRLVLTLLIASVLPGCLGGDDGEPLDATPAEEHPLSESSFTWDPFFPEVGQPVRFEPTVRSSIADDQVLGLKWTLEGEAYTESRPLHAFARSGDQEVSLVIQTDQGGRFEVRQTVEVAPASGGNGSPAPPAPGPAPTSPGNTTQNQTTEEGNTTDPLAGTMLRQAIDTGPAFSCGSDEPNKGVLPSLDWHCVGTDVFTVDGRSLGFTDDYDIFGVRPGMNIGGCSTSFLLTDGTGDLFLTQSAHCVFDVESESYCDSTFDPIGSDQPIEGYTEPATLVYVSGLHMQAVGGSTPDECTSYDLAILRLPGSLRDRVHPAVRHIGGPTGLADVLDLAYEDPMTGYGNSDDRGFVVEFATGQDHGTLPLWPRVNVFEGYYVGAVLNEAFCQPPQTLCSDEAGEHGFRHYVRYTHPKITGDSGSADLTADGEAFGVTSVINLATALTGTVPLFDALLKIAIETGHVYQLVTWDEWSPDTLET